MNSGKESMVFSIQSDIYSFGVFLVELISGRKAVVDQSIIEWVNSTDFWWLFISAFSLQAVLFSFHNIYHHNRNFLSCLYFVSAGMQVQNFQESSDISAIADSRMTSGFTSEGMKELLRLASWCLNPMSETRPSMSLVEAEIHRIREQEIRLTTVMSVERTPTVTLGSQLFRASRWRRVECIAFKD